MRQIIAITALLVFMLACQPQVPQVPQVPAPSQAYYPPTPGYEPMPAGLAYWDYQPESARHVMRNEDRKMLGAVEFKTYAFGANEAKSVAPNTPLEYRISVHEKASGSPPLEPDEKLTIFFTVIYADGSHDDYGTPNIPEIHPNNFLRFNQEKGAWVADRGFAQNKIGTQRIVGIVSHNGHNHKFTSTIKTR